LSAIGQTPRNEGSQLAHYLTKRLGVMPEDPKACRHCAWNCAEMADKTNSSAHKRVLF